MPHYQNCFMMAETFVPIFGYEGLYEIGNMGTVRYLSKYKGTGFCQRIPGGLKKPSNNRNYLIVSLSRKSIRKTFFVHRLVAHHFIDNPKGLPEVNHKDGNKFNCAADNLEWTDRAGNERHAYEVGLKRKGDMWGNSKPVIQYSLKGEFIKEWTCLAEIQRVLNFHRRVISDCCKGFTKESHGFKWVFK
jgi:hypothetical protein